MPAHDATYYSLDDVLALPNDGQKYELAYGKLLVSPSPLFWHQRIVMRLAFPLIAYCARSGVGEVFSVAADLTWGRQDVLAQPDVFVIGTEDSAVRIWSDVRRVPLIVEVISPSSRTHDRFDKRRVYQDRAVDLYWIIDPVARCAEVWTPEAQFPMMEYETLTWSPAGAAEPFSLALGELLAD
ncbi:MAG: Uma2 family endonuclease [Gemmatimonadota bacterium]